MPEVLDRAELAAASRRGAAFARLVRPTTFRAPVAVLLAAGLGEAMGTRHVLGAVLLVVASYGVATITNDLADVEVDRANGRSDRPLVTGDLAPADARRARAVCLALVVLAQLLLVQPLGGLVTVAAVAVGVGYSSSRIGLQRRGLWGTGVLAASYFVLPIVLSGARFDPLLASAVAAAATATLLYKDAKDEAGDRAAGKRTPLVRHGAVAVDRLAAALGSLGIALGLAGPGAGWWTTAALVALVLQLRMALRGQRGQRPVVQQRCAALLALVLLAATA